MEAESELGYAGQDRTFRAAQRSLVPRPQLLDEIDEGLSREGIVVLRAPWGYGKTTLLREYASRALQTHACTVVNVDFASPEVMAYMAGSDGELERALVRGGHRDADEEQGAIDRAHAPSRAEDAACVKSRHGRKPAPLRVPARYVHRASRTVWLHLRGFAVPWARAVGAGQKDACEREETRPLLLIDNLPRLEHDQVTDFARALHFWASRGAHVVIACVPSSGLDPRVLPHAHFLGPDMLGASEQEMGMWARWLSIARDVDVKELTNGVPALVGACARIRTSDARCDVGFLHTCEHVMSHVLVEPLAHGADLARRAMMVLGHGRLSDVAAVGALCESRELEELAFNFPMLGIDSMRGLFCCPPLVLGTGYSCVRMCVEDDEKLGGRCVELLLRRGEVQRAGLILGFLPPRERARLLEAHPAEFADVLVPEMIGESVEASRMRGFPVGAGHEQLQAFADICRDKRPGEEPCGFAGDIAAVLGFWQGFAGFAPRRDDDSAAGLVNELGQAGLAADIERYTCALARLEGLLAARKQDGLGEAALRCHAALCGILCGQAGRARAWLAPFAERKRGFRFNPSVPSGVADALLAACVALAGHAEELASSKTPTVPTLDSVRASKRYLEDRQVGFGVSLCACIEALLFVTGGDEARAEVLIDVQMRRWSQAGCCLGQAIARLGKAHCALVQNHPFQAREHAALALGIAQKLRYPRLERLSRLYLVVALIRRGDKYEIGEHELVVRSQADARRGHEGASLLLARALIDASQKDLAAAREGLEALAALGNPMQLRLAALVGRALGSDREAFVACMPRELLREYGAVRDARRRPTRLSVDDDACLLAESTGLLNPDRGLSLQVFGMMGGTLNGRRLQQCDWGRTKGMFIACLLALRPDGRILRDELADVLYSSETHQQRMSAFNTTLSCLRTALGQTGGGPEYIIGSMGTLGLNYSIVDTDVRRFEQATTGLLAQHDEMTLHELIDECNSLVHLFGLGPDERLAELGEPVARRVEQLRDRFADCMLVAVDACYARGEFDMALGFARHADLAAPGRGDVEAAYNQTLQARARKGAPESSPRCTRASVASESSVPARKAPVQPAIACTSQGPTGSGWQS